MITAVFLFAAFFAALFYLSPLGWLIFVTTVAAVAAWEWGALMRLDGPARILLGTLFATLCAGLSVCQPAAVGLGELAQRDVQTLSGGERQRLSIATLLAQAPQLYLLDEPLAHLDLNHQIATLELFSALARERGIACVMVLHEPGLAVRFCSHALLLFGDGSTQQGGCDDVISSESLSRLYGYPLREVGGKGQRWFMPA